MNARGAMIGQIIDDLEHLASITQTRGQFNLYDVHTHAETIFGKLLSIAFGCDLVNLNAERSNTPGLDLGDKSKRIAFQVTARPDCSKINDTLNKITEDQLESYDVFYVFVIVKRQRNYRKLDQALMRKCHGFSEGNVVDYRDIPRRLMDQTLDQIYQAQKLLQSERQRLIVEFEVPDSNGNFQTSVSDQIEPVPIPQIGSGLAFANFLERLSGEPIDSEIVVSELQCLSSRLSRLPRVTREFFLNAVKRADFNDSIWGRPFQISEHKVKRIFSRVHDWEGEIDILIEEGFASFDQEMTGAEHQSSFSFDAPGLSECRIIDILSFLEETGVAPNKAIVALDFSDF